jgi:GrpB-like predicted nucleotidyltransferase (UPF0157 family)
MEQVAHIEIVQPRSEWAQEFGVLARPLREALGDLALRIDHIGSTSVEGLPAKDVIDIQVTVAELDRRSIGAAVQPLGYTLRDDITRDHVPPGADPAEDEWSKLYFRAPEGQRRTHLHVRQVGRANQQYPILFRDYLRARTEAANAYAQIKYALARLHPDDEDAYYDVKDPACDLIMQAAVIWATQTGWSQGRSDA